MLTLEHIWMAHYLWLEPTGGTPALPTYLEPANEVEVLLHVGGQHEVYDGGAQCLAQAGRCVLQEIEVELPVCLTPGLGAGHGKLCAGHPC